MCGVSCVCCVCRSVCVCVLRICVSVIVKSCQRGNPDQLGAVGTWKEKKVMSVRQLAG